MANKGLGLPQTKGMFQLKGKVFGTQKDSFYKEIVAKNGKPFRMVNFGVQVSKDEVIFLSLTGGELDKVYFSGKPKNAPKDSKNETVNVEWKNRHSFNREGFRLIGVMCGLEKTLDEKGKEVNDKRTLIQFDAADYVSEKLQDGMSVFVKGSIDYSHFAGTNGEVSHSVKFIPNQISLCQSIDFDDEKYEPMCNFTQDLVFLGIDKNPEEEGFLIEGTIVNFKTVETATFHTYDKSLATNFRKQIKPYTSIAVWGDIRSVKNAEEVTSDDGDGWGTSNKMKRVYSPYKTIRVITGANPQSMNTETYTEKAIADAIELMKGDEQHEKSFESSGTDSDWGSGKKDDDGIPWD